MNNILGQTPNMSPWLRIWIEALDDARPNWRDDDTLMMSGDSLARIMDIISAYHRRTMPDDDDEQSMSPWLRIWIEALDEARPNWRDDDVLMPRADWRARIVDIIESIIVPTMPDHDDEQSSDQP